MRERRASDQWAMIEVLAWTLLALMIEMLAWTLLALAVGLGALIEIRSIETREALERIELRLEASEIGGMQ